MNEPWEHCILTYVDLTGIIKLAEEGKSLATHKMREMHRAAKTVMQDVTGHAQAYCWNDSALFLAHWDQSENQARRIRGEIFEIFRSINEVGEFYAVTIKGQTFPEADPVPPNEINPGKCVVLRTSSYAMANCLRVEHHAKELQDRPNWYVDSRLKAAFEITNARTESMQMLPDKEYRDILLLDWKKAAIEVQNPAW